MKNNSCKLACAVLTIGAGLAHMPANAGETTLYGVVGVYAGSVQTGADAERKLTMRQGNMQTSFVGIKGEEEVGNGLSTIFELESFLQPDTGIAGRNTTDPFWSRNAWVGLRSRTAGTVAFGRHTNPYYVTMQMVNPFGASTVWSPLVLQSFVAPYGGTVLGDTVWNKAITYTTPKLHGWNGNVIYSFGDKTGDPNYGNTNFNNVGINAIYATPQSPLTIGLAAQRVREVAAKPSTEEFAYIGGVAYDFKRVKLYGSAEATHSDITDLDAKTYQIGAGVPVTPKGTILASWANTKLDWPVSSKDTKRDTAAVGYDYFLTKNTDVQAVYLYDKVSNKPSGSSYMFGIRRAF